MPQVNNEPPQKGHVRASSSCEWSFELSILMQFINCIQAACSRRTTQFSRGVSTPRHAEERAACFSRAEWVQVLLVPGSTIFKVGG